MSKDSIDSISFELTHKNTDILPSQSVIESPLKLQYSISRLSISHLLEAEPAFSIHVQHEPIPNKQKMPSQHRFQHRSSHFFEFGEDLRQWAGVWGKKTRSNVATLAKGRQQIRKNTEQTKSLSTPKREKPLRSKSNESQHDTISFCVRSKAFLQAKPIHQVNQNQEATEKGKTGWLRDEPKQKSTCRNGFYERQANKKSESGGKKGAKEDAMELGGAVTAKRLNLGYNEGQARKYLQKVGLNRQNILHQSHRICLFPVV